MTEYRLFAVAVAVFGLLAAARADVIEFKSGKTREGRVIRESADEVVFQDPFTGEITFKKDSIKAITRTDTGVAPAGPPSPVADEVRAHRQAGRYAEAFTAMLKAVQEKPDQAAVLRQPFQECFYELMGVAQQQRASDLDRSHKCYQILYATIRTPAAASLSGDPGSHQRFQQSVAKGLSETAYDLASKAVSNPARMPEAQQLLTEAVTADPANANFRFYLAEVAKANKEYTVSYDNYEAVTKTPGAPEDLVRKSNDAMAQLRDNPDANIRRAPSQPIPTQTPSRTPAPVAVAATPAPAPPSAPTAPANDIMAPPAPDAPKWKHMLYKTVTSAPAVYARELGGRVLQGEGMEFVLGIPALILIVWVIPFFIMKWIAARGDIIAGEFVLKAKWMGMLAFVPFTVKHLLARSNIRNRCPFCNKGIDNIDSYADLNFYVCPHCRENITPIYDMKDYVDHLLKQLEAEAKRQKGGAADSMIEKDAMVKLVKGVLTLAVRRRASDLHIDPEMEGCKVRGRIDGMMYDMMSLPRSISPAFVSAIKIMANLDITERRMPQDGKMTLWIDKNDVDLRINTSPASMGEKVSIRILNQKSIQVDPTRLGLDGDNLEKYERAIRKPHGLIAITGPSGSGKSTTLYVAMNEINTGEKNIITLEDPIEYQLKGLTQMQVNTASNFTFSTGLRSILRQDPDVIMVGEIRDAETAQIAVEAAMTGHLVFTTLHTIDTPTAFSRFSELGVEPRRVSQAIICLIAQRLIRSICPTCKKPYKPKKSDMDILNLSAQQAKDITFVAGGGCEECMNTGYFGRLGLFEVLVPDESMREILDANASVSVIRELAKKTGCRTLREEGVIKVAQGVTTVEEVIRVTS